jgi:type VI secretion system Hcp family effector
MAMAFPFYLKVHGSKQGDFKGDSLNPSRAGWIDCRDFELDLQSPRDQISGLPVGKRQWKPIVIVKQWSAASPQFLQALVSNELLSSVTIEFESVLADGTEGTYYAVQLTNASVTEVRQYLGSLKVKHSESIDTYELERVHISFQKIDILYKEDKQTFSDSWLE